MEEKSLAIVSLHGTVTCTVMGAQRRKLLETLWNLVAENRIHAEGYCTADDERNYEFYSLEAYEPTHGALLAHTNEFGVCYELRISGDVSWGLKAFDITIMGYNDGL